MPAFESRRVRTQPFTLIATSFGASPTKILRTLKSSSVHAQRLSQSFVKSQLSKAKCGREYLSVLPASLLYGFPVVESSFDCLKISGVIVIRVPLNRSSGSCESTAARRTNSILGENLRQRVRKRTIKC